MSATAVNPTRSGLSILFADPTKPHPIMSQLKANDAICVDLDLCSFEPDGSLGTKCRTLIDNAGLHNIDVILAAKKVRFHSVPGLDKLSVTLIQKPSLEMTGEALARWLSDQLSHAMALNKRAERGFRSSKQVDDSEPAKINEAYLKSNLRKEQEEIFRNYVTGASAEADVMVHPSATSRTLRLAMGKSKTGRVVPNAKFGGIYSEQRPTSITVTQKRLTRPNKPKAAAKTTAARARRPQKNG